MEALRAAVDRSALQTQSRMVRGLEALDDRAAKRQAVTDSMVAEGFAEVNRNVQNLTTQLAEAVARSEQRMEVFEARTFDTLANLINVLRHLRSEVAALSDSVGALQSDARMADGNKRPPKRTD